MSRATATVPLLHARMRVRCSPIAAAHGICLPGSATQWDNPGFVSAAAMPHRAWPPLLIVCSEAAQARLGATAAASAALDTALEAAAVQAAQALPQEGQQQQQKQQQRCQNGRPGHSG